MQGRQCRAGSAVQCSAMQGVRFTGRDRAGVSVQCGPGRRAADSSRRDRHLASESGCRDACIHDEPAHDVLLYPPQEGRTRTASGLRYFYTLLLYLQEGCTSTASGVLRKMAR